MFRTYIETTETNKPIKQNNPTFYEKYQNTLFIKLFGLVFCLFRFNRNIETLCFGIEAKQPKQTFCSDSAESSGGSIFGCFESNVVSKDTLAMSWTAVDEFECALGGESESVDVWERGCTVLCARHSRIMSLHKSATPKNEKYKYDVFYTLLLPTNTVLNFVSSPPPPPPQNNNR